MKSRCLFLWMVCWTFGASVAVGEDAATTYQALYGQKENTATDYAAFAEELLKAAKVGGIPQDLRVLLCEKSCAFGIRTLRGYSVAVDAMTLLQATVPGRQGECEEKLLEIRTLQEKYGNPLERKEAVGAAVLLLESIADRSLASGQASQAALMYRRAYSKASYYRISGSEELVDKMKSALAREAVERKVGDLTAQIKANPGNAQAAKDLVMQYLVGLDDPARKGDRLLFPKAACPVLL